MPKAKKPLVIVTRKLPDSIETRMRELFDAQLNLDDRPMSQAHALAASRSMAAPRGETPSDTEGELRVARVSSTM